MIKMTKLIEKQLLVNGINIYKATPENLMEIIAKLQASIASLHDLGVISEYVDAKIDELERVITKVVKELDKRVS